MILRQQLHMVLQGIQSRCRQYAGLPHAAAQRLAPAPRVHDEISGTQQHRSGGRAQTLRQAHRHRIEARDGGALVNLQLHDGVKDARAVQMGAKAPGVSKLRDLPLVSRRQHAPPDGILERQQPRRRKMDVPGFDGLGDAFERDSAVRLILQRLRLDAAENRGAAALVAVGVSFLTHEVFVAAAAMRHQGGQIALRAGGEEQRALEAEAFGHRGLQAIDGGVVAVHVVAHGRVGHGGTHARRRARDRVTA